MTTPTAKLARAYFLFQGLAGAGWWAMLLAAPGSRRWFAAEGPGEDALLALVLADLSLYAGASLACAWRLGRPGGAALLWFTCGAVWYATLAAAGLALFAGAPWLGAVLMTPSALLTSHFAAASGRSAPCSAA